MAKFEPPEEKADYLQSLAKGLAVVESFGPEFPEMTLSTIARRVGLSPGSARRVLLTLMQLGFVGFKDQRYHLTARRLERDYMGVGTRFPAHATSAGKLLLAELSDRELEALYPPDVALPALTPFTVTKVATL